MCETGNASHSYHPREAASYLPTNVHNSDTEDGLSARTKASSVKALSISVKLSRNYNYPVDQKLSYQTPGEDEGEHCTTLLPRTGPATKLLTLECSFGYLLWLYRDGTGMAAMATMIRWLLRQVILRSRECQELQK